LSQPEYYPFGNPISIIGKISDADVLQQDESHAKAWFLILPCDILEKNYRIKEVDREIRHYF
jgi:hypothetical protein